MKNKSVGYSVFFLSWCWVFGYGASVRDCRSNGVLPSHPLVFARLDHVEKHVDQVINSDFGKNIAAIDLPDVLSRNNFSSKDISDFKLWQKDLVRFWDNPLIKRFLGKEACHSYLPAKIDSYQVFIVLRLTLSTRIAEFIAQLFHHWGDGVTVSQQKYQGRVINHILFKKHGLGVAYVRIRDLLIIAP